MKTKNLLTSLLLLMLVCSCNAPKLGYFQDLQTGEIAQLATPQVVKIQPGDKLTILVSSKKPELAYIFNLNIVGHYQASSSDRLYSNQIAGYTVNQDGTIDFPVIGTIHVAGMTRSEVTNEIKQTLISRDLLKDPIVTVNFVELYFSVMGEVNRPGRFQIDHDMVTIIDALSRAGDLTIYGKRDNVLVMRMENGKQMAYRVDLTKANELYSSPVFYLKQDDIVYVEPNTTKANMSTVNGNTVRSTSFWMSMASLLMSLSVLIFK